MPKNNASLNIALVAPYAEPEKGACPLRVKSLRLSLEKSGHRVTVFSPHRQNSKPNPFTVRYHSPQQLMSSIQKGKFNVVWGTSPPMTHSFLAGVAAKISGSSFVADVRDPWSYVTSHSPDYAPHPLKRILFTMIDWSSYIMADQIWVVTDGIQQIITRTLPFLRKKIHVIPNGTTPQLFHFDAEGRTAIRKKLGIRSNELMAIYVGGFVGWEVDTMLASLVPVIQKNALKLVFVVPFGEVESDNRTRESNDLMVLRKIVSEHGLEEKVIFVNEKDVPLESLSDYLSAGDIGLATVPKDLFYCFRVKAYDYAAAGLAIVAKAPAHGTMEQVIQRTRTGTCSPTWDDFASDVKKWAATYSFSKKERSRIIAIAATEFDRDISNKKAEELIQKLARKESTA